MKKVNTIYSKAAWMIIVCVALISCQDFVDIPAPQTDLVRSEVFKDNSSASAAMADIYFQLNSGGFASGDIRSISFLSSLSSDELINYSTSGFSVELSAFNQNEINPNGSLIENLWAQPYNIIYRSNAVIEGLNASSTVADSLNHQLVGEALFMRAFCHFNLVNLFGRVPIVTTTDYEKNTNVGRSEVKDVYAQIIEDLAEAKSLLVDDYSYSHDARIRVNKSAASALLSRVYLFAGDYSKADAEATLVVNDPLYGLEADLTRVFSTTSVEAIWQVKDQIGYPNDIFTFYIFSEPTAGALRTSFVDAFEPGDQRSQIWIGSIATSQGDLYFPKKYQSFLPQTEYTTLLRLAEVYLIRAEARARQDDISGALEDLNTIRNRAQLADLSLTSKAAVLDAIFNERRSELFCEWGHRWADLRRFGKADALMPAIKPSWESTDILYPIPNTQLINSPSMAGDQNPGY